MATSNVAIDEAASPDKRVATHSITEDAVTKELQRVVMNTAAGADLDPAALAAVALDTSKIANGDSDTLLTPKFAKVSISAGTTQDVVALVASKKIRVLAAFLTISAAGNVTWRSGGSTTLTGAAPVAANGGYSLPFNPVGWFETVAGEKLDLLLSASGDAGGCISYIEV